jgi:hypothetical protein
MYTEITPIDFTDVKLRYIYAFLEKEFDMSLLLHNVKIHEA